MPNPTFGEYRDSSIHGSDAQLLNAHEANFHYDVLRPSGVTFQNFALSQVNVTSAAPTAGTLYLTSIPLPAGYLASTLWGMCGGTALVESGTGPHFWMALFDNNRVLLGQSTDDTSGGIPVTSLFSKSLATPVVIPRNGQYYVGFMADKGSTGTQNTLCVMNSISQIQGLTSAFGGGKLCGSADAALGATAPNPAAAITATGFLMWAGVS